MKILSLSIFLLSASINLLAQQPYFEEENIPSPASEINQVNGIAADANNCIWLTTQSGIYRYDGSHFRHYSIMNTAALKFERMAGTPLVMGNHDFTWCIKDGKGNLYVADSLSHIQPFLPSVKDNSQIIFGNYILQTGNPKQDNISPQLKNNVVDVRVARSSNWFYILLDNGDIVSISEAGLLSGKAGTVIYQSIAEAKGHNKIFTTSKSLYAVTAKGILRWETNQSVPQPVLLKGDIVTGDSTEVKYDNIMAFQPAGQNNILIWYAGSIYEVNEIFQNNTLTTRLLARGSAEELPLSVFYSPAHQLLMTCFFDRGLVLYHPRQFSLLTYNDPKTELPALDYYYSLIPSGHGFITINNSGIVWLGTDGSRRIINKGAISRYFLFKDKAGNIWYQPQGEQVYISYLQAGTGRVVPVFKAGARNVFTGMYQPDDSTYYILTNRSLLKLSLKADKTTTTRLLFNVPDTSEFNMLYALNSQILWLGSDRELLQYNIVQNTIKPVNDLANTYVRAAAKLGENNYLVGTYDKGIYQYRNNRWIHLSSSGKSMPASAHAFIVDSLTNSLWVSSNEGILRIALQQLLQNDPGYNNDISFEQLKNFGSGISTEFNGSSNISAAQLSDTSVAFANAKGLVIFNPRKIISPSLPSNVLLESVSDNYVNDSLASGQDKYYNQIRFNPVIPYFGNREGLEVLYYLTRADNNWHKLILNSIISYNNLSPGPHDLKFRIKQYGDLKGTQALITADRFYVPYRWYQTTWFRIVASVLVLLLLVSLHYLRVWYVLGRDKKVRQLLEKYHLLFDNSPVPMWVVDPGNYHFVDVNEAAIRHYGYSKKEFLGMTLKDIRPDEEVGNFLQAFAKPPKNITSTGVFKHRKKDGTFINVEIYSGVIIHNNKPSRIAIVIDITKKLEYEKELQELSVHLQNIREEERTNISREIHDELGQQLAVLKMDIHGLNKKIGRTADDTVKQKIQEVLNLLDETVRTIRRIASDLRPSLLDDLGLIAAMEWQLEEFEKKSGIKTSFIEPAEQVKLPDTVSTGLFRIFQESLTNVARHADAKNLKVSLELKNNSFVLNVTDDGIGFDKLKIAGKRTLGLLGMRERTAMIGGTYDIISAPGKGTTVSVTVPLGNHA
ncbi:MAG: PAS domain S-box protein [Bacteroidota bacterium]|nr:PAS domain S-box protein [Bacteroidota bacterium]